MNKVSSQTKYSELCVWHVMSWKKLSLVLQGEVRLSIETFKVRKTWIYAFGSVKLLSV